MNKLSIISAVFYAWVLSVSSGVIFCDIVYARFLNDILSKVIIQALFSEAADIFLWMKGVAILAAIGAIVLSWSSRMARKLFAASLLIIVVELIFPVFVSKFFTNVGDLGFGPWIRVILSLSATTCAFMGLVEVIGNKISATLTPLR